MTESRTQNGLIHNPSARRQKAFENRKQILDFLRSEIYSSTHLLSQVVGLQERGTRRLLQQMVDEQLLVMDEVKFLKSRALRLWGISPTGLFSHLTDANEVKTMSLKYHTPGRVAPLTIEHTLLTQKVKLMVCAFDFDDWVPTRLMPGHDKPRNHHERWPVYPDGLQRNQHNPELSVRLTGDEFELFTVAHEIERTRKTPRRYVTIIKGHAFNIQQGRYTWVHYWCGDRQAEESLRVLFERIVSEFESPVDDMLFGDVGSESGGLALSEVFRFCCYMEDD